MNIDFRRFTEPVVKALAKMGVKAEHTGRNDLTIDGKKFSGNAQYHYRDRMLHHGTLLFNSRLENVQQALNVKPSKIETKGIKSVRSRVTNIIDYLENKISIYEFRDLLLTYLFDEKPIREYKLTEEDQAGIKKLMQDKYLTWEWNYGSSPAFNLTKSERFACGEIEVRLNVNKGLIEACKIYGDFFSNEDIDELAAKFVGVRYKKEDLAALLEDIELNKYFGSLSQQEFLQLLI